MFTVFTLGLLVYVYHSTVGYLRRQSIAELDGEVQALAAFNSGGMARLNQSVIERSSVPGPFFYVLLDAEGENLRILPPFPTTYPYRVSRDELRLPNHRPVWRTTIARSERDHVRLPNQASLMVAYDLGTRTDIADRVTRTIWTALPIGLPCRSLVA